MIFMETVGMILCGGFGKRLRPLSSIRSKKNRIISANNNPK